MEAADTGFMIICSALVMLMVPALALFYGGLVQARNVLSTTMHSFVLLGLCGILWAIFGYSLAFGTDHGGVIGGFSHLFLQGVGLTPREGERIPHLQFMIFQGMFAALTPALISGAYAERIKFKAMVLFSAIWMALIYCPMAHWVWGGGWLMRLGALDFAGGAVVHMCSAAAALAAAQVLGHRLNGGTGPGLPHNLPLTVLGAGLLWFGWFGFNAGSALAANAVAVNAFVVTHLAAAGGVLGWLFCEWRHTGIPTTLGAASGALAGLVAITPAAGFVDARAAIILGLTGGMVCYGGIFLKRVFRYDDALDVVGIHGIGGIWGALGVGVFARASINGVNGWLYGNFWQFWVQALSVAATLAFCYCGSFLILKLVDALVGLRPEAENEIIGLDQSQHRERAYQW